MEEIKLVKDLAFGETAKSQVLTGVEKLTNAVGSTLGASGKCCLLYTSPSPRDRTRSRMPSSA